MTKRLTTRWTESIVEAFGPMGAKGERGERIAKNILENLNLGYVITHHPSDKRLQLDGIDLYIGGKFGVDVKNNLKTNGDIGIEQGKLFKSKATFWMHVNDEDHEDFVFYKVESMKEWLKENTTPFEYLVWVPRHVVSTLRIV